MTLFPIRLVPGQDLRPCIEAVLAAQGMQAAYVLQGMGSLEAARLRFAGARQAAELRGDMEILTLAGSVSPDGAHLHMTVADAQGRVCGGHVARGCIVRTTAEVLLALLPAYRFSREQCAASGHAELVIRPRREENPAV